MNSKKMNPFKMIVLIVLASIIGFGYGYFSLMLLPNNVENAILNVIVLNVFHFFIGYLLQLVVHEVGHFLFGRLTGYSFVSLRVGYFMLFKYEGRLQFTLVNKPGLSGQCLMSPPEYNNGKFPYILYNSGGVLLNLIASAAALLMVSEQFPLFVNMFLVGFGLSGIYTAIINGMPVKLNKMATDGHNILSILKDPDAKWAFWIQLKSSELLFQGVRPKDLPLDMYKTENMNDLTQPLNTSLLLIWYDHYLDQLDFEKARACLEKSVPYLDKLASFYRNEINLERLFLELIGEKRPDVVEEIYNEELKQYIQVTSNWPNRKRILMAYEGLQQKDPDKAMKYYQEIIQTASRFLNMGEAKKEITLANWLKEQFLAVS